MRADHLFEDLSAKCHEREPGTVQAPVRYILDDPRDPSTSWFIIQSTLGNMAFSVSAPKVRYFPSSSRLAPERCEIILLVVQVSARSGARCVAVRAQKAEVAKQASTAAVAAALATVISVGAVDAAYADVAGLTPCSESKGFEKLRKTEVKKLEKRKKQVSGFYPCNHPVHWRVEGIC